MSSSSAAADSPRPFTVLAVCTANQCRSPMIELELRQRLSAIGRDWTVRSAGTRTEAGRDLLAGARTAMIDAGLDDVEWSSTPVTQALIEEADLIIAAGAEHRAAIAKMSPRAMQRTYLLKQLQRMSPAVEVIDEPDDDRAAGERLLEALRGAQGSIQPVAVGHDDLADPSGQSRRAFRRTITEVAEAIDALLRPVTPA